MHDTSYYWGLITLSPNFCSSCELFYFVIWDNVGVPWSYDHELWSGVVQFFAKRHLFFPLHPRLPWCSCWLNWWLKRTYYCVFFWFSCFYMEGVLSVRLMKMVAVWLKLGRRSISLYKFMNHGTGPTPWEFTIGIVGILYTLFCNWIISFSSWISYVGSM